MTLQFINRTAWFVFAVTLTQFLIATSASAQVVGVKVVAEFHDEIVNSWPAGGVNKFKTRTTAELVGRLRTIFMPEEFASAEEDFEYIIEITVDPGDFEPLGVDYAISINIIRNQQGGKTVNDPFFLTESVWQGAFPGSPEAAIAYVVQYISRLLRRRAVDFRKALAKIKGRRLPISMNITELVNPGDLLDPNTLNIEPTRPIGRAAYTTYIDSGLFIDHVELPNIGRSYEANLRIEPRTGNYNPNSGAITKLCLRAAARLTGTESLVDLRCPYGGKCTLKYPKSVEQLVRDCGQGSGWLWPALIGTAQAQPVSTNKRIWYAPSLRTLRERRRSGDIRGVGYTVFTLRADKLADLKADAFTYQVSVNGTPVHVSGVPPRALVRSLDPKFGFELQFGLENHYFRGIQLGCDVIGVELKFLRNRERIGQPIHLKRPYIALRDAALYQDPSWPYPFKWYGHYKMPREGWEYELFIGEDNFNWVPPESRADFSAVDLEKARHSQRLLEERMQWNRQWIDKRKLPGPNNTRLVGVLRPPLSIKPGVGVKKLAYGIALGLEDLTSGQVFFTFTKNQRDAHKAFFEAMFAELSSYSGNDPVSRKLKETIGIFEKWFGPPKRWRKYQIGSNDDPTPPGFCESLPSN